MFRQRGMLTDRWPTSNRCRIYIQVLCRDTHFIVTEILSDFSALRRINVEDQTKVRQEA